MRMVAVYPNAMQKPVEKSAQLRGIEPDVAQHAISVLKCTAPELDRRIDRLHGDMPQLSRTECVLVTHVWTTLVLN